MNDDNTPERVAMRMESMYRRSRYTPYQRATDAAFAYDSTHPNRKYWLAVLDALYKLTEGEVK